MNESGSRSPRACRYYSNSGSCFFGDSCQFVHDVSSLHQQTSSSQLVADTDSIESKFASSPSLKISQSNSSPMDSFNSSISDCGFVVGGFPPASGAGGSLPPGSRLQTYINMNQQQRKIWQNGGTNNVPSHNFSSPSFTASNSSATYNQNFPSFSSSSSSSAQLTSDSQHRSNNYGAQQMANHFGSPPTGVLVHNFSQMGLHGNTQTSTPADLPHSLSTPTFNSCSADATTSSLDAFHNLANIHSPRNTPTPPNAIPMMRNRLSKSPSAVSDTPPMVLHEAIGGTTYFYNTDESASAAHQSGSSILPNFFMYGGPMSNVHHLKPRRGGISSFFVSNELKMDLMRRHLLSLAQADVEHHPDIPQEVDCYNLVVPLENMPKNQLTPDKSRVFNCTTSVYKANSTKDGLAYCFRRIHGCRFSNQRSLCLIETWKKIQHSNVVQIREVFTTKLFGDNSLVFVYDYFPGAETLRQRHFAVNSSSVHSVNGLRTVYEDGSRGVLLKPAIGNRISDGLMSETLIWCYIVQLSSALRSIHAAGLAARTIEPSKILVVGKSRLLVNCCGVNDVLTFDHAQSNPSVHLTHNYQQDDLMSLGRIVLALACHGLSPAQREQLQFCVEHVNRNYSTDLKNLILYLLAPNRTKNVNDIMPMIGARFYSQIDAAQMRIDLLENELSRELENGRLFRLLSKLATIIERPEHNMDPQWSETGDRYLLKLFRDYLFHQINEEGKAWLDMTHIVQCLNKLDAGVSEKILLSSRDQQNVLVVSYADLRRCLDQAFNELVRPVGGGCAGKALNDAACE